MEKPPNSCHAMKEEEKKAILSTGINTNHEPFKELESTSFLSKDIKLESTRDEIREIKDENQRLKLQLSQIMKDYEQLHTKFYNVVQQEKPEQSNANSSSSQATFEGQDVVCDLSLGRTSSNTLIKKDDIKQKSIIAYTKECNQDEGLTLGLEYKYDPTSKITNKHSPNQSPENNSEVVIKEVDEQSGSKAPSKKTMRGGEDEDLLQNPMKKARVCVRVRCDTPTINDGCQWRKYGQKIAKGNPCPRAYYRCTVASSCPVRKQVQRCVDDMSILITTYEGTHNHPLSMSATAMASTTSAALSMLMSGSKTSNHNQSYMPNSSLSTSTSSSHPTITLDLTSNPTNKISPNFLPKYSSTNLNFSSFESNPMPPILNHGNNLLSQSSLSFGKQIIPQENFYNSSFMQNPNPKKLFTPDNVAAATRAITSDPSFHSALATALSSIIGSRNVNGGVTNNIGVNQLNGVDKGNQDHVPTTIISNFTSNGSNNCSSSYSNIPPHPSSTNAHTFLQSLSFSTSKSKSTSPSDNTRDHIL